MKSIMIIKNNLRLITQIAFTALTNGYANGFLKGKIYQGNSKNFCVPGLNCYSCPGALGSCPIGALQAVLSSPDYKFSFYIVGFLMAVGAFLGRFVCGFLCPFGLVQDLLYRIPVFKKMRYLPGERYLNKLKYVILIIFVILLPLTLVNVAGIGSPWFCKLICPSGTLLGGIPLVMMNSSLKSSIGWLFTWKMTVLVLLLLASIKVYRPFCRYLCPLGAIYGVFNPFALYRFEIHESRCTGCKICQKTCGFDIPVYDKPNSPECIRCGACMKHCPHKAIVVKKGKRE